MAVRWHPLVPDDTVAGDLPRHGVAVGSLGNLGRLAPCSQERHPFRASSCSMKTTKAKPTMTRPPAIGGQSTRTQLPAFLLLVLMGVQANLQLGRYFGKMLFVVLGVNASLLIGRYLGTMLYMALEVQTNFLFGRDLMKMLFLFFGLETLLYIVLRVLASLFFGRDLVELLFEI